MRWLTAVLGVVLFSAGGNAAPPAPSAVILVASEALTDPNFHQTVVLVTRHAHGGAVGVVLNRPTRLTLEEAFPQEPALRGRTDVILRGGPVSTSALVAVVRSAASPGRSLRLLGDVWMTVDRDRIDELLRRAAAADLRIFGGHAGWAPGQLEAEIQQGAWHVLEADVATIFGMEPATMWTTLRRRVGERKT